MKSAAFAVLACLALGIPSVGMANDLKAEQRFAETTVGFELRGPYRNITLTISGPNEFHAHAFAKSGAPSIDLLQFGAMQDGAYTYQLTAATDEKLQIRTQLDNGRDPSARGAPVKGVSKSGTFNVRGGAIVRPVATQPSRRDQDR